MKKLIFLLLVLNALTSNQSICQDLTFDETVEYINDKFRSYSSVPGGYYEIKLSKNALTELHRYTTVSFSPYKLHFCDFFDLNKVDFSLKYNDFDGFRSAYIAIRCKETEGLCISVKGYHETFGGGRNIDASSCKLINNDETIKLLKALKYLQKIKPAYKDPFGNE